MEFHSARIPGNNSSVFEGIAKNDGEWFDNQLNHNCCRDYPDMSSKAEAGQWAYFYNNSRAKAKRWHVVKKDHCTITGFVKILSEMVDKSCIICFGNVAALHSQYPRNDRLFVGPQADLSIVPTTIEEQVMRPCGKPQIITLHCGLCWKAWFAVPDCCPQPLTAIVLWLGWRLVHYSCCS